MKNNRSSYPQIRQAIGMTLLIMLILFLFSQIFFFLKSFLGHAAALFTYYTMAMSVSLWALLKYQRDNDDPKSFSFKMAEFKPTLLIIGATLALLIGIIYPIYFLIPMSESTKDIFQFTFSSVGFFTFLALVIAAPVFEELLFRGIILDGLLKNYNSTLAIIVSSALFGVFHFNPLQIISSFIGGLFIGWIYHRTKNLSYCILIHFIVNLMGFTLLYRFDINDLLSKTFSDVYGDGFQGAIVIGSAILIFVFCVYVINRFLNKSLVE